MLLTLSPKRMALQQGMQAHPGHLPQGVPWPGEQRVDMTMTKNDNTRAMVSLGMMRWSEMLGPYKYDQPSTLGWTRVYCAIKPFA
jgi:hypothetical protein